VTSVNIKEETYFVFFEKAKQENRKPADLINDQLIKDIKEKKL
jgi:hypothetical protein